MPTLGGKIGNAIVLALDPGLETALGKEGYRLEVRSHTHRPHHGRRAGRAFLRRADPSSSFLGVLKRAESRRKMASIPCCRIEDKPRFPWRGLLLDEGRHFFGKEFVMRYIDLLAAHNLNTLHWHLTEDQGWRIEIKKYPMLTEIGSRRRRTEGDGNHGGFYTQDDIRDVVAYAARHVTIVPEIEMPGHALAALTAYPQLSCTGGPFKVAALGHRRRRVLCRQRTFGFLEDVLGGDGAVSPTFIHIGGVAMLNWLGIAPSHSRPRVSNDNPYAEALFRTAKYRPEFPERGFADRDAARDWAERFVHWYNNVHRHSAIRYVTPAERHAGADHAILSARHEVYQRAQRQTPARWSRRTRNWTTGRRGDAQSGA